MTESICQEAERITNGDRRETYGGTDDTIVSLWSAYLGLGLTVLDYANLMILLKVARTKGKFHRDSYVDMAGYANVGTRLWLDKQELVRINRDPFWEVTKVGLQVPKVYKSLTEVDEGVVVYDSDGDGWVGEGANGPAVYDKYGPFTLEPPK